jgi:uncharacterized repeat protein (TIGR03803 family)
MKCRTTLLFVVALSCWAAQPLLLAHSDTLKPLHYFSSPQSGFLGNAGTPIAPLILVSNTLYGVMALDQRDSGYLFRINGDGSGFTNFYTFPGLDYPAFTNSGGIAPNGIAVSGDMIYGVAQLGGLGSAGTIFSVNVNGSNFTTLHSFAYGNGVTNADGMEPSAGVIVSSNVLYGTTQSGGLFGKGTVFRINTDGSKFTNLYNFNVTSGGNPLTPLILSGNTLFGATAQEGASNSGAIFRINPDGSGFTNLLNFPGLETGESGIDPLLALSGNTLYASYLNGNLFKLNTDGSGITNLFVLPNDASALVVAGNIIFGSTYTCPSTSAGTIFRINTDGSGFAFLHTFAGLTDETNSDGASPDELLLSGNVLYGTADEGGTGSGTVFALTMQPPLGIASQGNQVVVSWPTWGSNFVLQTSAPLSHGTWSNITSGITTDRIHYFFNPVASSQAAFFQLSQP